MKFGSFENPASHRNEVIEATFEKSVKVLKEDEIDQNDFRDLYGDENVDKDFEEIDRLEKAIGGEAIPQDKESLRLATVLEAMIHYHGEQSEWFESDAETFKTSRYDDLKNGTDGVVEFAEENSTSHLAFGIDATYGHYSDLKIKRILERIKEGSLARIKYFESEATQFRGELKKVPLFVIGVASRTIVEVAELWLEKQNKELAKHPIQMQILQELLEQAKVFADFAEEQGQLDIAKKYKNIGAKVMSVIKDKLAEGIQENHDDLYFEISHQLERQVKEMNKEE